MSPSASVAVTTEPMLVLAAVFSATLRVAVASAKTGALLVRTAAWGVAAWVAAGPAPAALTARTRNSWASPLVSPVTVAVRASPAESQALKASPDGA